jgi:hypothetical protein
VKPLNRLKPLRARVKRPPCPRAIKCVGRRPARSADFPSREKAVPFPASAAFMGECSTGMTANR